MANPQEITSAWPDLFASYERADGKVSLRVLKKGGEPFLILPAVNSLAARALELYPAQSSFARAAKWGLRASLRAGLPFGLERTDLDFARSGGFAKFLRQMSGGNSDTFPAFAILAGNARAAGRRFIVLLFDASGEPRRVVKAGLGEIPRRLIQQESSFLQSAPAGITGLLAFHGSFDDGRVAALALEYMVGDSPRGEDRAVLEKLFSSWLNLEKRVKATELTAWQRLASTHGQQPLFKQLSAKLAGVEFFPTLYHGDFAPWNIKVSPRDGSWQVLDWERGESAGFPAWDWFHFCVQRGVLVEKLSPEQSIQKWEGLLASPEFKNYAARAGIAGNERMLAVAYIYYCVEVLQQSEGNETVRELLAQAAQKWLD